MDKASTFCENQRRDRLQEKLDLSYSSRVDLTSHGTPMISKVGNLWSVYKVSHFLHCSL